MKFDLVELPYQFETIQGQSFSNDLFILNQQFFVKRSKPVTKAFLDWTNQINFIALIKSQNFTLPILETKLAEDKLWTLLPYYPDLCILNPHTITAKTMNQLANLVQALHAIPIENPTNIKKWDALAQLNQYAKLVMLNDKKLINLWKQLQNWSKNYQPKKWVLSHNDLVPNNFVCHNHQWYLIDWDFATLNDPLFDIASFASETLTNNSNRNYWYTCFQLQPQDLIIVKQWITYQNFIWYQWASFLYQQTKDKGYYKIAQIKLRMLTS